MNPLEWQTQILVATKLKELARKHRKVIVSPYQIDATGEARFAKGILDPADIALILEAHEKDQQAISMETTKIRGGPPQKFTSPMNWDTLRMSPIPIERPQTEEKKQTLKRAKRGGKDDSDADIPWDT